MKDWLCHIHRPSFVICLLVIAALIAAFDVRCDAQVKQYLEFPDFTGGLASARIGKIQPNQCLGLENFLLDNGEIRVRDGYGHISDEFSTSGVKWIGLYRKQGTAGKLMVQAGTRFYIVDLANNDTTWTDNEYSELFVTTGTVSKGDSASYYLYSGAATTAWESYAFTSITLDSITQTSWTIDVSYAVNDSTLRLATALPEKVTGWTFSVTAPIGDIVSGETFVDSFYLATSTGALNYNDSTLLGTQTQNRYRAVPARALIPGNQFVRYYVGGVLNGTTVTMMSAASSGTAFLKSSLRQVGHSSSLLSGEIYYMTQPILGAQWETYDDTFSILVDGGRFAYDTALATPIISVVEMEIDPTTAFTIYMDSVIFRGSLTDDDNTIFVDDSLMSDKDSTFFASGDWFFNLGTTAVDNYTTRRNAIIGNYLDDSLRFYGLGYYGTFGADTLRTDEAVTFFRRKVIPATSTGYIAATFWNDRWCQVKDSTSSQIDFSEDFEPNVSSGYLVQVNPDDGEPILWLKQMYGTLIIGKNSSIWKLTGVPGLDAFARLDRAIDGLSFVAPRSIVSRNNLLFGLGNDGFYVFDFNSMVKISHQIDDLVRDSINWDMADKVVGGFWDGHFWWSYPSRGSLVNDRTIVYNPTLQAWATSTLDFGAVYVDKGVNDTANVYLGEADAGQVHLYGKDNDDDGTAISATLLTGWFNMGSDWVDKLVNRGAFTNHRKAATALTLALTAARPDGQTQSVSRTISGANGNYRGLTRTYFQADQLRGTQYQLQLSATTADSLRVGNLGLEYQVESTGD